LEFAVEAIYSLSFYSGSSVCPAAVWIIFTRILKVILASQYKCLVELFNSLVQLFNTSIK